MLNLDHRIPLEEMAKIFGDTEDILMYAAEDVKHGPTKDPPSMLSSKTSQSRMRGWLESTSRRFEL
jgi:hypothetical protein